jgi:hypothetical protein
MKETVYKQKEVKMTDKKKKLKLEQRDASKAPKGACSFC